MKKIVILCAVFMIVGCARGQWISASFTPIPPAPGGFVKNYTLGEKRTAFIGQEIIKVEMCDYFQKTFTSPQDISANGKYNSKSYDIIHSSVNHQYPVEGTVMLDNKNYYVTKGYDRYYSNSWGILILEDGSIHHGALYNYDYQMVYISDSIVISPRNFNYSTTCVRGKSSSISFELIFSGKNDVSLNATYKEYTVNDLARPAFFQNLTYQAGAKQIRFKDFIIQVHNATNEQITYTVSADGLK